MRKLFIPMLLLLVAFRFAHSVKIEASLLENPDGQPVGEAVIEMPANVKYNSYNAYSGYKNGNVKYNPRNANSVYKNMKAEEDNEVKEGNGVIVGAAGCKEFPVKNSTEPPKNYAGSAKKCTPGFYWTTKAPHVITIDPDNGVFENQTPLHFYSCYPETGIGCQVREDVFYLGNTCIIHGPKHPEILQVPCGKDLNSSANIRDIQYIFTEKEYNEFCVLCYWFKREDMAIYNTPQGKAHVLLPGVYEMKQGCVCDTCKGGHTCSGSLKFEVKYGKTGNGPVASKPAGKPRKR